MLSNQNPCFAWLAEVKALPRPLFVAGPGYITPTPGRRAPTACATLDDALAGKFRGFAIRATAMVAVRCGTLKRYALIYDEGTWQFPSAYCHPYEFPLHAATRALSTELRVSGHVDDWRDAEVNVGGTDFAYLMDGALLEGKGRFLLHRHTVEFFYPVTIPAPLLASVHIGDATHQGRDVRLFRHEHILQMACQGEVNAALGRLCDITSGAGPVSRPTNLDTDLAPLWSGATVNRNA